MYSRVRVGSSAFIAAALTAVTAMFWADQGIGQVGHPLTREQESALKAKDVFRECEGCPEMVVVPPGEFVMGSPDSEKDRERNEGPQHRVRIDSPFAVGKYEVTLDQFRAFVSETGHTSEYTCFESRAIRRGLGIQFSQKGNHPVVCVTWADAKAYVSWLSKRTGKAYRLLTESEWEYVARAGSTTQYASGDTDELLCQFGNVFDQTMRAKLIPRSDDLPIARCHDGHAYLAPVGSFAPNSFGVYDTLGNVTEWVEDCWNQSYFGAPSDGSAWQTGRCDVRVVRGDSYHSTLRDVRSAARHLFGGHSITVGFRVARTLSP